MPMQLALETSKAINGMLINYEVHDMAMEEMRARLVESERMRWLLYEEVRRLAGEKTRLNETYANLRLSYNDLVDSLQDLNADESIEANSMIQRLQETVAKLEEDKKTDAALYAIATRSINMLHNRISKLEHQVSGFKGVITKKRKLIMQLRQASGV